MARIAAVTLPLTGHIRPMCALLRRLAEAGHDVRLFGPIDMRARLPKDMAFTPIAGTQFPKGSLDVFAARLRKAGGFRGLPYLIDQITAMSRAYITDLPAALSDFGADALIHDQLEPGAGLVAKGTGLTHISLAAALPINREPNVPPPFLGWAYRNSDYGRWLNQGGYRVVDYLMAPQNEVLARGAQHFGLSPDKAWDMSTATSDICDLSQSVPVLDYPRERVGSPICVGPLRDLSQSVAYAGLDDIADERTGQPLVFGSLGTLMGGRTQLFKAMAAACARHDRQLLIAHGGQMTESDRAALPDKVIIRDFVNQTDILPACDAAMIHGGFNTVLDAMTAGVPLVIRPIAFEQTAIAARVVRLGAGVRKTPIRGFSAALGRVIGDESYRAKAQQAARQIQFSGGTDRALRYVEAALTGTPILQNQSHDAAGKPSGDVGVA